MSQAIPRSSPLRMKSNTWRRIGSCARSPSPVRIHSGTLGTVRERQEAGTGDPAHERLHSPADAETIHALRKITYQELAERMCLSLRNKIRDK